MSSSSSSPPVVLLALGKTNKQRQFQTELERQVNCALYALKPFQTESLVSCVRLEDRRGTVSGPLTYADAVRIVRSAEQVVQKDLVLGGFLFRVYAHTPKPNAQV